MQNDFRNFAVNHLGMSSNTLDGYTRYLDKTAGNVSSTMPSADYMNPYILEERQLNVTQMDVFSRLMMDRIIFLGTQVSDTSANIIQAQLLYLDSRWFRLCRTWHLRHDAVYFERCIHYLYGYGRIDGRRPSGGRRAWKAFRTSAFESDDPSAYGWNTGPGFRHRDYRPRNP